jgi:hypothetical protein
VKLPTFTAGSPLLELGRYPQPGDVVEVEGLGTLANRHVRR